jgi:hypothetical protein
MQNIRRSEFPKVDDDTNKIKIALSERTNEANNNYFSGSMN